MSGRDRARKPGCLPRVYRLPRPLGIQPWRHNREIEVTVTVLDSADLVEAVTTGKIPVPKGIAEDNKLQAAKREAANVDPDAKVTENPAAPAKVEEVAESKEDDIEGEDGLTPRQKREFTESMLKTIGKKHRRQMEAEEFATAQYNERQLAEA